MSMLRCACCALSVFLPAVVPAQQPVPAATGSRSVTFDVSVTDHAGHAIGGLKAPEFKVLDNKAQPADTSVKEVSAGAQSLRAILVIDAVNVPYTRVAYERDQLDKYLKTNGGVLAQPTTIAIVMDKGAQISKGFTTDGNALKAEFDTAEIGLREIRRDTGVWGADDRVRISLTALQQLIAYSGSLPGRKAIVWISPGWPLLSGARIDLSNKEQQRIFADVVSYSRQMQKSNAILYNINPLGPEEDLLRADYYQSFIKGVSKPSETQIADLSLQVLSAQSGGIVSTGNSDVAGMLAKDLDDARSWYEVTVKTGAPEQPDEYHHIQVSVDQPGATVRTRDGYYAQP